MPRSIAYRSTSGSRTGKPPNPTSETVSPVRVPNFRYFIVFVAVASGAAQARLTPPQHGKPQEGPGGLPRPADEGPPRDAHARTRTARSFRPAGTRCRYH